MDTINKTDARRLAVFYGLYKEIRAADLNSEEDTKYAISVARVLKGIQTDVGIELVETERLEKLLKSLTRMGNVYNS